MSEKKAGRGLSTRGGDRARRTGEGRDRGWVGRRQDKEAQTKTEAQRRQENGNGNETRQGGKEKRRKAAWIGACFWTNSSP